MRDTLWWWIVHGNSLSVVDCTTTDVYLLWLKRLGIICEIRSKFIYFASYIEKRDMSISDVEYETRINKFTKWSVTVRGRITRVWSMSIDHWPNASHWSFHFMCESYQIRYNSWRLGKWNDLIWFCMVTVARACRRSNRIASTLVVEFYWLWCHGRFRTSFSPNRFYLEFQLISNNPWSRSTIVWLVVCEGVPMPCTMSRSTVKINRRKWKEINFLHRIECLIQPSPRSMRFPLDAVWSIRTDSDQT